jgi:hypothetical protein
MLQVHCICNVQKEFDIATICAIVVVLTEFYTKTFFMEENPIHFVNLTPHTVVVRNINGTFESFPPSGAVARIGNRDIIADLVGGGFAFRKFRFGEIENLPTPQKATFYIVSGMVKQKIGDLRLDVISPGELIRDENGQPIACDGFVF